MPHLVCKISLRRNVRNKDLGGSGLGLAISKSIIDMHYGAIKAKNSRLCGLKVIIYLPLYKNET